ncbi:MAG: SAM-dependent methyltransferase [Bacteroidales bacterium]|nr:SAM-dependent methyltransferase [Bacteroidales bacterium]
MEKEEKNKNRDELIQLILIHINNNSKDTHIFENVVSAIKKLLNEHYVKYNFDIESVANLYLKTMTDKEFQQLLFKLNEKNSNRKELGVYYTPSDVTKYIIYNAFINHSVLENAKTHNANSAHKVLQQKLYCKKTLNARVFDPTCGSGEFLINALDIKVCLLKSFKEFPTDKDYLKMLSTIFGNDINEESVDITKIRLFFEITKQLTNHRNYTKAVEILNANLESYDYLQEPAEDAPKYEIIVGNPPYVEYGKVENPNKRNYGNIYADILENSVKQLTARGSMGFVIPLSYVATTRMKDIRNYIRNTTCKQIILSYADRPDCLFDGVHQKLCILFANKGGVVNSLYTSNYKHWYKAERESLLNGNAIVENAYSNDSFIAKIGNQIEKQVFSKVYTKESNGLFSQVRVATTTTLPLYLNMRGCFWVKAFTFNPGSKEYKRFDFNQMSRDYVLCLFNSSLFWMYWTIVSDCWHITCKELKHFIYNDREIDIEKFHRLTVELENKLEKTKEYIGTKQADYAYKHSKCKDIIDEIDDEIAKIYNITDKQLKYIKEFALKYRSSNGAR